MSLTEGIAGRSLAVRVCLTGFSEWRQTLAVAYHMSDGTAALAVDTRDDVLAVCVRRGEKTLFLVQAEGVQFRSWIRGSEQGKK